MNKLIGKTFKKLTLIAAIVGIIGWCILYFLFPESYCNYYFVVPVFFWLFYGFYIYAAAHFLVGHSERKWTYFFLGMKIIKMLLSLTIILLYIFLVGEQSKIFSIVFMAFYLIWLIIESSYFATFEKQVKQLITPLANE